MFSRRGFIKVGAATVGSLALKPFGLLPALAQNGPDYRALVCIFLFGGNDSNNSIIPMDDTSFNAYTSIRGNLALPQSNLTPIVNSISGAPYAFHAKLAELQSLFGTKELAVVANCGSLVQPVTRAQYQALQTPLPNNLFSHSDQQLQWQSSVAQGNSPTGWAGRAADYVAANGMNSSQFPTFYSVAGNALEGIGVKTAPVAVSPGGSLQLSGFSTSTESQARWTALNNLLSTNTGLSMVQAANGVLSNTITDANLLGTVLSKPYALTTKFPTSSLGVQLKQVAEIIAARATLGMSRQIFFCSLGGFDTHTGEIIAHNNLYPEVSPAMAAFYQATQELSVAENVTAFTESDFSRTFQPTSADGSDHGWGSHHFVVGGAVKGGQIYGKFPTFQLGGPDDTDTRGRWIPTTSIDQYGATLCSWFGIPDSAMNTVFPNLPNFTTRNIGFV
jgi:uncharacterized protein (DUF1501 family)